MKGNRRWALVAVLVAASTVPVDAQGPPRRGGADPMAVDRAAARALQMADELELTESQRSELQSIRSEALAALETLEQERLGLRQELRAQRLQDGGAADRTREEVRTLREEQRARMEAFRERERALTGPVLERYEGALGAEQRLQLRELQRDRSARARRSAEGGSRMNRGRAEFRSRRGDRGDRGGRGGWDRRDRRRWRGG